MSLQDLHDKQARLATEARSKLDEAQATGDEARIAEVEREFDAIMAEFDKIDATVKREQALAAAERRAAATLEAIDARDARRPMGADSEARGRDDGAKADYRMAFAKSMCGPLEQLTPEERAVLADRAAEVRVQTAGTNAAGGYTVPTEMIPTLIETMAAHGPMYDENLCTVITTAGGYTLTMPTVDDTAVTAEAHTEGAALTDDGGKDVTFGQKSLEAYSFDTEFLRWSWELEADSIFEMERALSRMLGKRLGRIANSQLTTGSGSSAPHGIVTASTAGKTAASATAVTGDEILDLIHSVDPAYRTAPNVRFMMNDSTKLALRKLKDGQDNYLWQMGDIRVGEPERLFGYAIATNQAMADMEASAKPIIFGDMSAYYVRKVGAPVIGVARERFWPDLGIAGLIRFDGELSDTAAIKHLIMDDGV